MQLKQASLEPKLLIIRFSSFGDIVHAMGVPSAFKNEFSKSQVDWLVRSDFASLVRPHPAINLVFSFDRKLGILGLIKLIWELSGSGYSHVYDAHNNVRSALCRFFLRTFSIIRFRFPPKILVRSKNRFKRMLLFSFRKNFLPNPFKPIASFQEPLAKWLSTSNISPPQFFVEPEARDNIQKLNLPKDFIALAPSASFEMKRWPVDHWQKLIRKLSNRNFVVLGGPEDDFCRDLELVDPKRVFNFAGKLSLQQSCALVEAAQLLISNDTGLMHVADQLGVLNLALIGPTAFGYPYHPNSQVAEISLWCKPCSKDGRGGCFNELYKRCLVDLSADQVANQAEAMISGAQNAQ